MYITRRERFSSSHRLINHKLNGKENKELFGKCYENHGHNYELIVSVTGTINPETGYVIDMSLLKQIIKEEIEDSLDHKNLNLDVVEFKSIIPTAENISIYIYNKIKSRLDSNLDLEITLYETPRNFVKYSGI